MRRAAPRPRNKTVRSRGENAFAGMFIRTQGGAVPEETAPPFKTIFQKDFMMKTVTIYTDGACSGNPGPGGWGAILMYGPHSRELSGGEAATTKQTAWSSPP